jgi:CYTH domain-containing protein
VEVKMGIEIEKKYLVTSDQYKMLSSPVYYMQGYLHEDSEKSIRIRVFKNKGFLAIKSSAAGLVRYEYEYEIPSKDAKELLSKYCTKPLIEKYRYIFSYEGLIWEVDEFCGDNEGLVIAEIELDSIDTVFLKPNWIGDEVTDDFRYYNTSLSDKPYKLW